MFSPSRSWETKHLSRVIRVSAQEASMRSKSLHWDCQGTKLVSQSPREKPPGALRPWGMEQPASLLGVVRVSASW